MNKVTEKKEYAAARKAKICTLIRQTRRANFFIRNIDRKLITDETLQELSDLATRLLNVTEGLPLSRNGRRLGAALVDIYKFKKLEIDE